MKLSAKGGMYDVEPHGLQHVWGPAKRCRRCGGVGWKFYHRNGIVVAHIDKFGQKVECPKETEAQAKDLGKGAEDESHSEAKV